MVVRFIYLSCMYINSFTTNVTFKYNLRVSNDNSYKFTQLQCLKVKFGELAGTRKSENICLYSSVLRRRESHLACEKLSLKIRALVTLLAWNETVSWNNSLVNSCLVLLVLKYS